MWQMNFPPSSMNFIKEHMYALHPPQRTGPPLLKLIAGGKDSPSSSRAKGVPTTLNGMDDSFNTSDDSGRC